MQRVRVPPPGRLNGADVASVRISARRRAKARFRYRASARRMTTVSFGALAAQLADSVLFPPAPEPLEWDDPAVLNPAGHQRGWAPEDPPP